MWKCEFFYARHHGRNFLIIRTLHYAINITTKKLQELETNNKKWFTAALHKVQKKHTIYICIQKECLLNNRLKYLIFFHRENSQQFMLNNCDMIIFLV